MFERPGYRLVTVALTEQAYQATPWMRTTTSQLIGFHVHQSIINAGEMKGPLERCVCVCVCVCVLGVGEVRG